MRVHAELRGVVQGVGFRPFVYRIALERGLSGWVLNRPDGVVLEVQGAAPEVAAFLRALASEAPSPARVEALESREIPELHGEASFEIRPSGASRATRPVVPPDLAVCEACAAEMDGPGERRYRYPFTNCTSCGPRYSIIESLPYDRPGTSMKGFTLCPDCEGEYRNPADRRFHAQPVACPACGPRLQLLSPSGAERAREEAALRGAVQSLLRGEVLALKGLGGYQLLVDAASAGAIARLRERKRREDKPFAVMFPDLETLAQVCEVPAETLAFLRSPASPILLLRRRRDPTEPSRVDPSVAPGNPRIGAFLPTTPLHRLLLGELRRPVVCTSGNLSEEPMAFQDQEALARLGGLADAFLVHDRPIVRPVDDSVLRLDSGGPTLLRRARGFAPLAQPVALAGPPVLALGAHQKNTVALLFDSQALLSQHLGDLGSVAGAALLERTVRDLLAFFRVRPEALACDLHPDYASTRLAERLAAEWSLPLHRVQHHHAHGAACAAEHGLQGPLLALAWDGAGLGSDGTTWGGEALLIEGGAFRRVGHLKPFPLPGGDRAAKEPRRSACGVAWAATGALPREARSWFPEAELDLLEGMLRRGVHCPPATSMGRLFDAVAALAGVRWQRGFEGQAAMALEFAAEGNGAAPPYGWNFNGGPVLVADPAPLLAALPEERRGGTDPGRIAARFHASLADLALAWARHAGVRDILLSGGCFQNALLADLTSRRLEGDGFRVHRHRAFPPNDGSISLGQAAVAACR
ncbi:MAG: carbamoyltransferase HypF [Acidobacteria bacterium]|nr:carbamoyltransferase HypF [Acidobacteriota bacterium]